MSEMTGHILVVDDNEMNRDLLSRRLRRKGFEVSVAVDGVDALEKMGAEDFDLILLDIMMPRMNGLEMLEQVREAFSVTELPIIMTTAKSDSETVVEALKSGANDYVTKPLDFGVVLARIKTHMEIHAHTRGSKRGGFTRLSDSGQFRAVSSRYYCNRCRSSIQKNPATCHFCHQSRPERGWPQVGSDKFPHLGRTIGDRYFLTRFIGGGSVGTVYQARDLELNREYAAKVISLSDPEIGVGQDELRERTTREVEVLSKLSNPHIVKIYDVVVVEDDVYALLLDHVRGYSLSKILERAEQLSIPKALDIARQVAQGLYEAHQLGIVHCDIKPDNIMLEKLPIRGHFAHILDFGVAEILEFKSKQNGYYGTPFYSAPEQFQDPESIDHRTDIYALGAVLFHMIEGRPPFDGENAYEILNKHITDSVPRLTAVDSHELDNRFLDDLLARMMAKSPEQRFPDLSGFLRYVDTLVPLFEQRSLERAQRQGQ
ncbi:MAG: protein kinase domain-containing protein [Persicimonas sp.]